MPVEYRLPPPIATERSGRLPPLRSADAPLQERRVYSAKDTVILVKVTHCMPSESDAPVDVDVAVDVEVGVAADVDVDAVPMAQHTPHDTALPN